MTQKDLSTITAVGVLTVAVIALLSGLGVAVPEWVASLPALATTAALALTRIYVATVGAENTSVDETVEAAEDAVAKLAERARK